MLVIDAALPSNPITKLGIDISRLTALLGVIPYERLTMKRIVTTLLVAALTLPVGAQAQGIIGGAQRGADDGAAAAGPIGGVVGGVLGGAAGGVAGLLGIEERPRFQQYVVRQSVPSYRYEQDVRVGAVLPSSGVTYHEVPAEYGVRNYRYTRVNNRIVLVDPGTHRIVEVIE